MAIWANQMLRSAIVAYQDCARTLASEQNLVAVEDHIATIEEIFRLQGASELKQAEQRYLPRKETPPVPSCWLRAEVRHWVS